MFKKYFYIITLLFIIITTFLFLNVSPILEIIFPNLSFELFTTSKLFFEIAIFMIIFNVLNHYLSAFYHSNNSFNLPDLSHLLINFGLVAFFLVFNNPTVLAFIYVFVFLTIIQFIFLLLYLPKLFKSIYSNSNSILHGFYNNSLSFTFIFIILITNLFIYINNQFVLNFSTNFLIGTVSQLNYAGKFSGVLSSVIINSIITLFFPVITKLYSKGLIIEANSLFLRTSYILFYFLVPLTIFILISSDELLLLFFNQRGIDLSSINEISIMFRSYIVSLFFYGILNMYLKFFLASNKLFYYLFYNIALIALNLIGIYFLYECLNIYAIPISHSLSIILICLLIMITHKKNINFFRNIYSERFLLVFLSGLTSIIIYKLLEFYLIQLNSIFFILTVLFIIFLNSFTISFLFCYIRLKNTNVLSIFN